MKEKIKDKIQSAFSIFVLFVIALVLIVGASMFVESREVIEENNSHFELIGTSNNKSNYIESNTDYSVNIYIKKKIHRIFGYQLAVIQVNHHY